MMQKDNKFRFKHSLGQNFLSDDQLLNSIVVDALVKSDSNILEIGSSLLAMNRRMSLSDIPIGAVTRRRKSLPMRKTMRVMRLRSVTITSP